MLGRRVKELRERQGSSLQELALKSGLPIDLLTLLEQEKVEHLEGRDLLKIADSLNLTRIHDFIHLIRLNSVPLRFKAYAVGLPKTGTTSIAGLFCNYRAAHEHLFAQTAVAVIDFKQGRLTDREFRNFILRRDVEAHLEMDSASFNHFYLTILADEFASARFVFTIRDCYSWLDSVINMYLRGDPARGYDQASGQWMVDYTEFLFGIKKAELENERELHNDLHRCVDQLLQCWAVKNRRTLEELPPTRSLIIRTHEISRRVGDLARFVGVPQETLQEERAHLYRASHKFNTLREVDAGYVEAKCQEHCSVLMREFFPFYSLKDYLRGDAPGV